MKNIEEKFFHGIEISTYKDNNNIESIEVFELILKSGRILSRQDLMTENPYIYYCLNRDCRQKHNQVCVAAHPNSSTFILPDYRNKYNVPEYKDLDAFYDWILPNISIILSEKIIIDNNYTVAGGLPREVQINNSINLHDNIEAIGYHDEITQIIKNIEHLIEIEDYDSLKNIYFTYYYNSFIRLDNISDIKRFVNNKYKRYNQIKELLSEYNYDIPILDPFTGKEHNSIEDSIINTEKILS